MTASQRLTDAAQFHVRNIGGIDEASVVIEPGVTVLTGENATNRTSFLQAVMAAMGSNAATLKADADEGVVELVLGDTTYRRTVSQSGDEIIFDGDTYLNDPEIAERFAFLLEDNDARRAVSRSANLREIIMEPVDIEEIKRQISSLESQKTEIDEKISNIESKKRRLPELEKQKKNIESQISKKKSGLSKKETQIDENSRNISDSREKEAELESKLNKLRSTRSDLDSVRQQIETQRESIESLQTEHKESKTALSELSSTPAAELDQLEQQIASLRDDRQSLNAEISQLQNLIQYNEDQLEDGEYDVIARISDDVTSSTDTAKDADRADTITDQLLTDEDTESETITCWTCGSAVDREQIEATVDQLKSVRADRVQSLNDVKSNLDSLKTEKREIESEQTRRSNLEETIDRIQQEIDRREEQLETLKEQRQELTATVEALEAEVDELESESFEDILSLHREANELEFEIDRLESDRQSISDEIESIEAAIDRIDTLETERASIVAQLEDERTKIDQIEHEAVEQFNTHMESILDILAYENLDRIWIERTQAEVRSGRQKIEQTVFELHVIRTTASGTAYEDTVEHLSESEREVTGLIFALAGYLVHDLYESVPFMLLDSLEAIDSNRIAALISYFSEFVEYLVVALLPEDAQSIDDEYARITDI
jgi:chromosome segregation ATPase